MEYRKAIQSEIVKFKFEELNNRELAMLDMIKEVVIGCDAIQKEQYEYERFNCDARNYKNTIRNPKLPVISRCYALKIFLVSKACNGRLKEIVF